MPNDYISLLALFAGHFDPRVWKRAQVLLTGAILARGQRTVSSALRVMGLSDECHFQNYHRVLNRAVWSSRALSQTLLLLLVRIFAPAGPIVIGGDETIERRRGERITAKGIYRDPVRSSHKHFVKASGLRWVTLMLLGAIPFAQRIWALPFLSLLAPSAFLHVDFPPADRKTAGQAFQSLRRGTLLYVTLDKVQLRTCKRITSAFLLRR